MTAECDKLIDYFNGTLTTSEKITYEKHLKACEFCNDEWKTFQSLTQDLPYLSEPIKPPEGIKTRVFASIFETDEDSDNHAVPP